MSDHHEAVAQALSQPIDLLAAADGPAVAETGDVSAWQLPAQDKTALAHWGVPLLEECRLVPHIQQGAMPELDVRGQKFYALGLFANHEIGVLPSAGEVWAIPADPALPKVFINSSVTLFVETTWRWYWTWKELDALRADIEQYDVLDAFLAFATTRDPRVGAAEPSLWPGLIQSW
ncbi:SUKH-4 family immunity protein [Streptomyces violascens]|uniref:SUKH-4 family immunity protein n=1 Tax=Streptomyces violascens TaxID=67381 RepID=UPI0036641444